jgi:hypothetical protein
MNKVKNSSRNITPFGGLNFALDAFNKLDIDELIGKHLGYRAYNAKYSYSHIIQSLFANTLSQGSVLADVDKLKAKFKQQINWNCPSADTIEYACQELKSDNIDHTTKNEVTHQFNYNNKLNKALIAIGLKTRLLHSNTKGYDLDFDNVVIPTEKQDAKYSYKKVNGYHPSFATIGRIPVHVENRNGNTPAKYGQEETLERCFDNLDSHSIKIKNFRADSASFQASVINLVEKRADYFYIRNMNSQAYRTKCSESVSWKSTRIGNEYKEIASIEYSPAGATNVHRVVVTRTKVKNGQTDIFTGEYTYYGILTNNRELTDQEVILFYNQRADSENTNRFLLNDFNLNHLPFPDMSTNTVYIYMMCICATLFEWFKTVLIENKTPKITMSMRAKAICFHYISVATEWIKTKREEILIVYSNLRYEPLNI